MASTISVRGEPERVNLVVQALKTRLLTVGQLSHLRSETPHEFEGAQSAMLF